MPRIWILAAGLAVAASGATDAGPWAEFQDRLNAYMRIREAAASGVPKRKDKAAPEEIGAQQKKLAEAIRTARLHIKRGEVFTPATERRIREVLRERMDGKKGGAARNTAKDGNPAYEAAPPVPVRVNGSYPDSAPLSTMPPSLLLRLPQLPEELCFRFVGRDLVLLDNEAGLIVDYITDAIP